MYYTNSQRIWWLVNWLMLVISFCVIGFWLVAQATGYRYNPHQHKLQKTGMIVMNDAPRNSTIKLDSQSYSFTQKYIRIPNVLPGTYRVSISKERYQTWEKLVTIKPGFVVNLDPVTLFLANPIVLPDTLRYQDLIPYYTVVDDRVRIVDGELWFGTRLVSRFSQPPSKVTLLPTNQHIAYLQGKDVRVIDLSGEHDQLLYRRNSEDSSLLIVVEEALVFQDSDGIRAIRVTE